MAEYAIQNMSFCHKDYFELKAFIKRAGARWAPALLFFLLKTGDKNLHMEDVLLTPEGK